MLLEIRIWEADGEEIVEGICISKHDDRGPLLTH